MALSAVELEDLFARARQVRLGSRGGSSSRKTVMCQGISLTRHVKPRAARIVCRAGPFRAAVLVEKDGRPRFFKGSKPAVVGAADDPHDGIRELPRFGRSRLPTGIPGELGAQAAPDPVDTARFVRPAAVSSGARRNRNGNSGLPLTRSNRRVLPSFVTAATRVQALAP